VRGLRRALLSAYTFAPFLLRFLEESVVRFGRATLSFGRMGNGIEGPICAIKFRNELLQYVHSFRTVTGVDLSVVPETGCEVVATQPSTYLAQHEREYQRRLAR
jgi:hypothetical protein